MSDPQWYIMKSGERTGPISQAELLSRAQSGLLNREELVWREGFTDWAKAGTIRGLFRSPPSAPSDKPQLPWWKRLFRTQLSSINAETTSVVPSANTKVTKRGSKIDRAANRKMIAQLHEDASDTQIVAAEMIREGLRRNPINIQIRDFIECLDRISENTPNPDGAEIVRLAIQSANFGNAALELDNIPAYVTDTGTILIHVHASELVKVWPKVRQLIQHRWLDDSVKAGEESQEQVRRAVQTHRQDIVVIEQLFRQMKESQSRYHAIMTRNDFWKAGKTGIQKGIRIAADQFSDQPIGVAIEGVALIGGLWGAWRQQSDDTFVESFRNDLNEFRCKALTFIEKTEREVEVVISTFVSEQNQFYENIIAVLERAIDKTDISGIYHKLHDPDAEQKIDDEGKALLDIVMCNLRDRKISARSEANIKRMLGIP